MNTYIKHKRPSFAYRVFSVLIAITFVFSSIIPPQKAYSQSVFNLPKPGAMVSMSPAYSPAIIKGITIHPENPLKVDFIVDIGDDFLEDEALKKESTKLIKYFLTSLTVPEEKMWVNLSPYEKDRIIPDGLGQTDMGRDLLAQDYILKQLTASLMYPEERLGNKFWKRVYKTAFEKYGTTEIPVNTFNKVWIVPDKAVVYVSGKTAFVLEHHLKVMLEEDYLALESNQGHAEHGLGNIEKENLVSVKDNTSQIIRELLIPEIEKEVNNGKNFAQLRQIFNSVILATWYKNNLKQSLLGQTYVDRNKTFGLELEDKNMRQNIYDRYIDAFEKGVYNYIKEDYDELTQEVIPRKYFSGGVVTAVEVESRAGSPVSSKIGDPRRLRVLPTDFEVRQRKSPPGSPAAVFEKLVNGESLETLGAESTLQKDVRTLRQLGLLRSGEVSLTQEALNASAEIFFILDNLPREGARRSRPSASYRDQIVKPIIEKIISKNLTASEAVNGVVDQTLKNLNRLEREDDINLWHNLFWRMDELSLLAHERFEEFSFVLDFQTNEATDPLMTFLPRSGEYRQRVKLVIPKRRTKKREDLVLKYLASRVNNLVMTLGPQRMYMVSESEDLYDELQSTLDSEFGQVLEAVRDFYGEEVVSSFFTRISNENELPSIVLKKQTTPQLELKQGVSIGIDIGGTNIKGVVKNGNDIIKQEQVLTFPPGSENEDAEGFIQRVKDFVATLKGDLDIDRIGLAWYGDTSFAGLPLLNADSLQKFSPESEYQKIQNMAGSISEEFSIPTRIWGDSEADGLYHSLAMDLREGAVIRLGTSVGGAYLNSDGQYHKGFNLPSRMIVNMSENALPHTASGVKGVLQRYTASRGFVTFAQDVIREENPGNIRVDDIQQDNVLAIITDLFADGETREIAQDIIRRAATHLAAAIADLSTYYDLKRVILAGSIFDTSIGELLNKEIEKILASKYKIGITIQISTLDVSYGAAIAAAQVVMADHAMAVSSPVEAPGGIDLNPNNIDIQIQGNGIDFNIPLDSIQFQNVNFDGLVPVIINVLPVTNLNLLLGKSEVQSDEYSLSQLKRTPNHEHHH